MEMRCTRLKVLPQSDQTDQEALAHWKIFASEYPEVEDRQLFFVTLKSNYPLDEEVSRDMPYFVTALQLENV